MKKKGEGSMYRVFTAYENIINICKGMCCCMPCCCPLIYNILPVLPYPLE